MTQRNNHPQTAHARPQGTAESLRLALTLTASAALILVLVLITGHASAGYGFV
jgi:hypothetical protein